MNKNQLLEYLLETNTSISWQQALFALLMSLVMGLWLYSVYRVTYRGTVYSKSFNQMLALLCVITTAVMLVISGNLALSLGMVGSLSIIRFRTAVKEPRDIAFLFWAVSIGLACGAEFYLAGALGSVLIAIVLAVANLDLYDSVSYLLVVRGQQPDLDAVQAALKPLVRASRLRMRSAASAGEEATFELRLKSKNAAALVDAVRGCKGVESVNLVSYSGESIG